MTIKEYFSIFDCVKTKDCKKVELTYIISRNKKFYPYCDKKELFEKYGDYIIEDFSSAISLHIQKENIFVFIWCK